MAQRNWSRRLFYCLVRSTCLLIAKLLFGLRREGLENWPRDGGGLVCANHQSYFDPVLVGVCCPRRMNYLARKTLFRSVPFRWVIQLLDAIPIDRDGMGIGGLKETLRRLKRGELVLIFPEGTRSPDGQLRPLQSGFVAVARRGHVPLVPVGMDGAYQAWPRDRRWPRRSRMAVCVGPPITADEIASCTEEQLVEELFRRIRACHDRARHMRNGEDSRSVHP